MGDSSVKERGGRPGHEAFPAQLYRQAGRRWLILAGALAVLLCLGIFAGRVRNPDAAKRQWAVLVSRILAGAGGFVLVRLLLFSYEERVPVLFFDLGSAKGAVGMVERIGDAVRDLMDRGYEAVPLDDVVEFVREQRYVPKKGIGLVIEATGIEDLVEIAAALPGFDITVLLPLRAAEDDTALSRVSGLPSGVSLGLSLVGRGGLEDAAGLKVLLGRFRERISGLTGSEPGFARVGPSPGIDLRRLLKQTTYTSFLDGSGFNRFGDEPHILRLLNATAAVSVYRGGKGLAMYVGLFKAKYYLWPAAAMMRLVGKGLKGT